MVEASVLLRNNYKHTFFTHTHTYLQGPKVDTRPTSPTGPMICPQGSTEHIDKGFHGIHALEGSPVSCFNCAMFIIDDLAHQIHFKN